MKRTLPLSITLLLVFVYVSVAVASIRSENDHSLQIDSDANGDNMKDEIIEDLRHVQGRRLAAVSTPTKRSLTPTRLSPSLRVSSPTKRLPSPTKRTSSLTKRPPSSTKRLPSPTKRVVSSPSKRPLSPTKKLPTPTAKLQGCTSAAAQLYVGFNTVSTCGVLAAANQRVCGVLSEKALTFFFVAPNNASYIFTTVRRATSPTILRVVDPLNCAQPLACNVSYASGPFQEANASLVTVRLVRGQRVHVTIGTRGRGCSSGIGVSVTEYTRTGCKPSVYPGTPVLTVGVAQRFASSCGPPFEPSLVLCGQYPLLNPFIRAFTAPSTGFYVFESLGASQYAMSVRKEVQGACQVLGCEFGFKPIVVTRLTQGDKVTVVMGSTANASRPYSCDTLNRDGILVTSTAACSSSCAECVNGGCLRTECSTSDECPANKPFCDNHRCACNHTNPPHPIPTQPIPSHPIPSDSSHASFFSPC